jgi:hypothetical protein
VLIKQSSNIYDILFSMVTEQSLKFAPIDFQLVLDLESEFYIASAKRTLEILQLLKNDSNFLPAGSQVDIETNTDNTSVITIIRPVGNTQHITRRHFDKNGKYSSMLLCEEVFEEERLSQITSAQFDQNNNLVESVVSYFMPERKIVCFNCYNGIDKLQIFSNYQFNPETKRDEPCTVFYQYGDMTGVLETRKTPLDRFKQTRI